MLDKAQSIDAVLGVPEGRSWETLALVATIVGYTFDSLEPKAEQRARLAENYQGETKHFLGAVFGKTLGEIQISETYDLALAIHSLYEFPRNDEGDSLSFSVKTAGVSTHSY